MDVTVYWDKRIIDFTIWIFEQWTFPFLLRGKAKIIIYLLLSMVGWKIPFQGKYNYF